MFSAVQNTAHKFNIKRPRMMNLCTRLFRNSDIFNGLRLERV